MLIPGDSAEYGYIYTMVVGRGSEPAFFHF